MKTILISVAHARTNKGATHGLYNEYDLSLSISQKIYTDLQRLSVPCHLFDASEHFSTLPYGRILQKKINWINRKCFDLGKDNCIALEVHHNSVNSKGYGVHYCAGSVAGRAAAKTLLERFAGRWTFPQAPDPADPERIRGLYERPGWYGGGISFLSDTLCPAIITEAESIAWPDLVHRLDDEAEIIREGLCRMVSR